MIADEGYSLGKMDVFAKSVSFLLGYQIRLMILFQNRSQLLDAYKESADSFLSQLTIQTYGGTIDLKSRKHVTDTIGFKNVQTKQGKKAEQIISEAEVGRLKQMKKTLDSRGNVRKITKPGEAIVCLQWQ